ncbi:sigma-54-dependent transcriptional regulator [Marinigracilibium pacificum]|uniref:Sigma-54-dependent Fis family transcriptional regulator n=1 Tax=Marinigracilibium pacificum TaxID=2729599 RepID=A0A848IXU0_9BACT|nr:sigma-54 dependent transcriptional regulator [Marinigracilibium pacificum]NMM47988.1 sigma-54-dependent Fis family transcriptional regulator [Marinigracilibium pacificum]
MTKQSILIVDDEQDLCTILTSFLEKKGFECYSCNNGEDALRYARQNQIDLSLIDLRLPDEDGITLMKKLKIFQPDMAVLIITGYSDIKTAVNAIRLGASDYVSKPLYTDEIYQSVIQALEKRKEKLKQNHLSQSTEPKPSKKPTKKALKTNNYVLGTSDNSKTVFDHIKLVAPTDISVILTGETGTGKEVAARLIHENSKRSDKPFVAIDCGALPEDLAGSELFGHIKGAFTGALQDKKGSFEVANTGTIFLDEIGNLSYENQVKLLRAIQEKEIKRLGSNDTISIDVRIIVATNENLRDMISSNNFREDLYHRLNEFSIHISPLRERTDDIPEFADFFLNEANNNLDKEVKGFSAKAMKSLMRYQWHGNLREMKNVIKRAVLLCNDDEITQKHLPQMVVEYIPDPPEENFMKNLPLDLKVAAMEAEKSVIIKALKQVGYNKSKAADLLNIDRKTLYNKLKSFNLPSD